MTATVIDLDKAREGRPSRTTIELYRRAAQEQRLEGRIRATETERMVDAIEPHLRRLELLARATGAPTAIESVHVIRGALASHARRSGVGPERTA